jgi:rRNA maturation RNase YbeY
MAIFFHSEGVRVKLARKRLLKAWLEAVALQHGQKVGRVNAIFVSDDHLLEMNQQYLGHDYYTDIITFQYSTTPLHGDLYISLDRVIENARDNNSTIDKEIVRILVHGLLHLCGFQDKTRQNKQQMTSLEDNALVKLDLMSQN